MIEELIEILARFGGGQGGSPNDVVVRFLLPTFFWCALAVVSLREWHRTAEKKDLYIGIASLVGMSRELLMFVAEYGSLRGFVTFQSFYYYYPPLEHAATMLSCIFIGYAFMNYLLSWGMFPRMYFVGASVITLFLYGIIAPGWIAQLGRTPGIPFGSFWGDMAFRISATIFMGAVIAVFAVALKRGNYVPKVLFVGFGFFFLDEFLMIFNLATHERHVEVYAPIRHNLHIWAIPVFLGVYWTEMKKRITEAESAVKSIFDMSPSMLVVVDAAGNIKKASPASRDILGMGPDDLQARTLSEAGIGRELESRLLSINWKSESDDTVFKFEEEYSPGEGSVRWLQWNVHPVRNERLFYVTVMDITDRKNSEEEKRKLHAQLVHAHKMEAVGHLAGGVAHDFNNILSAITGYGHLVLMKIREDDELRSSVEQILHASERAGRLTYSLLAFSRNQVLNPQLVNVNDIIENISDILSRLIGEDIELKTNLTDDCMIIKADAGQLEQILMNLATNARDAMPGGGLLTIESRLVELDEQYVKSNDNSNPGRYAMMAVTDSGTGIGEAAMEKIFEPFFTTKETGKGTGLGLSMAYGIVKQHDGFIDVQSETGVGTSFKVYLPIVHGKVCEPGQKTGHAITGGTETILVAEDDDAVRTLSGKVLRQYGYTVIEARDGEDAVHMFQEHREHIDLLLLDVIMPGMNGKEVHETIRASHPDMRTIFFSGYATDLIQRKGMLEKGTHFISKPVMPQELLRKVRSVLDAQKSAH